MSIYATPLLIWSIAKYRVMSQNAIEKYS